MSIKWQVFLQELQAATSLSQTALAAELGVSQSFLSRLLKGTRKEVSHATGEAIKAKARLLLKRLSKRRA
jgi:transcriptional regulator with XRE-family HTH domain